MLAFLAVFVNATHETHATQAIAFEWKPGFIARVMKDFVKIAKFEGQESNEFDAVNPACLKLKGDITRLDWCSCIMIIDLMLSGTEDQSGEPGQYDQKSIRYTGRNIPSRSFRMLQSMTGGEASGSPGNVRGAFKKFCNSTTNKNGNVTKCTLFFMSSMHLRHFSSRLLIPLK